MNDDRSSVKHRMEHHPAKKTKTNIQINTIIIRKDLINIIKSNTRQWNQT